MPRRKPRGRPLDGWLIIDKPPGLTSTDVVNRVRRAFDAQKAGHGGTLDPLGHRRAADRLRRRHEDRALRHGRHEALPLHPALRRGARYRRCRRQGHRHSARGPATSRSTPRCPRFRGDIMQMPPAFSAVKVAGERAYDMAREGRAADAGAPPRPGRPFELIERPDPDTRHLRGRTRARASTCAASPATSPSPAAPSAISPRCAACGSARSPRPRRFRWTNCCAPDDIPPASPDLLLPVATALADIPALALTEAEAGDLSHGQAISLVALMGRIPGAADPDGGLARAMAGGRVIGLAGWRTAG